MIGTDHYKQSRPKTLNLAIKSNFMNENRGEKIQDMMDGYNQE